MPSFKSKTRAGLDSQWPRVGAAINRYDDGKGIELVVRRPSKTREQEEKYHAILGDIARHGKAEYKGHEMGFAGHPCSAQIVAKVAMLAWFEDELKDQGKQLTSPSGWIMVPGVSMPVMYRARSSEFTVKEGGWFIEFLLMICAENKIPLSDPESKNYEQWAQEG